MTGPTKNYKQALGHTIYTSFFVKFDVDFNDTNFNGYLCPKYGLCHRKIAKDGRIYQIKSNIGKLYFIRLEIC